MTASREAIAEEPLATVRQLELLRDMQRLANDRARDEERIRTALAEGLRAAERFRDKSAAEIEQQYTQRRGEATASHDTSTAAIRGRYEEERNSAQQQYKGLRQGVETEHARVVEAARSETKEVSWEAMTVFDALKGRPREHYQEAVKRLERSNQELAVLEHDATAIMRMRRQWREFPPVAPSHDRASNHKGAQRVVLGRQNHGGDAAGDGQAAGDDAVETALGRVEALAGAVREAAVALNAQKLPRLFEGGGPFGVFFVAWILAAAVCAIAMGWQNWWWIAASLVAALAVTGGVMAWLWPIARRHSGEQFQAVRQLLADARQAVRHALDEARQRGEREAQALVVDRDQQIAASKQKLDSIVDERERWKESQIGEAGMTFPQRLAKLRDEQDRGLAAENQRFRESLALLTEDRDRRVAENRQEYERKCRELRADHDRDWESLAERWQEGLATFRGAWDRMQTECERLFPDWEKTEYADWPRPTEAAPAIRFGQVTLDLKQVKNGVPQDERLRPQQTAFELPALMTLDEHPALVISAEDDGRREAIDVLQLAMLRLLTAMPPGKVRFTILDPVGLGENFASFMHLADFDEQLIASRIWTDGRQIEEQLTRLTAHMETVLQKYLRNEFATIHEYNAQAGEVAEPFQVLVVANFPTNFSEVAARKLVSIATSGPRCGVYTLIMVDRKQKMPASFDLKDLTANAVHLDWVAGVERQRAPSASLSGGSPEARPQAPDVKKGYFRWRYPAFEHLALALDRPPSAERLNDVIRAAGRAAKDSMRVEVPFEQVAPPENEYWTGNCAKELVVPIGRAGARRLQSVRLGKGTSQHLLVCGKTGSGKSTFLHAFVTNTALIYSPDEVEFYLIDFKKGVEFKTYATHRLPHARVIAIESEREFGLSVLERLDAELKRRGDLFRAAGVQDVPDFRKARPGERMPRVLLVVDEFQELFVEDDKLAQDSALLLDRLVRQGRAFGIHVLLGSQTLSGAYSLARSTTGQMAVRVALQCSEADASLILPDERNDAARFLSRPGEAIYNDQNGILAGNSPFQVVWLPEAQRIEYLKQIEAKDKDGVASGERRVARSLIVFEGDQPADPADNVKLREVLERGRSRAAGAPQHAWLGAAVAIKEPTVATFGRHAGSNLMVVGAWDESALGVLTNAVVALAAQNPPGDCPLFLSEGDEPTNDPKQEKGTVPLAPGNVSQDESPREGDSPLFAAGDSRQDDAGERKKGTVPARFYVLDGTRPESPEAGTWQRVAEGLPHKIEVGSQRDTARIINEVATELSRREAAGEDDAPPVYLVIFNGGRFRELRRGEDDFSFSMDKDKPPSPDKQWAEILRNGPAWGVFTLLWCDSYNNVNRMLERMTLREFEMRVAFQMSAADSSSFLDTPAATRLNVHRGLFASEDLGTLEKFRPYGVPTEEWLEVVHWAIRRASTDKGVS